MAIAIDQLISLAGAFLILLAYAFQSIRPQALGPVLYQSLNAIGASALCFTATINAQYGFIILEGTWALISITSLLKILRNNRK